MINFYEYNALRAYTHREKSMIEAYYKRQNSTSFWILDPSLIVASLFHSHFEYEYKESDYGSSIMKFQIHEAMALSNALSTLGEPIFENLHSRLSDEIAKWKPSLSALTFEQWYHKSGYQRIFGEFEELDELLVEMLQQTFNDDNIKEDF
ncbi:hypothetical protein [Cellulophaga sp. BC115SP]|uniref:hypothetical protein n=1 Tax=Cellulophaga sp. BC115SP TaxID=2683263 RepID=UPI001413485A|nr:hypothetical protein [Cellulophaga sp. BC115SP]NBB30659.1 hypothetical protein [Cellulophaga sp. BC115SP]